ncbi:MAG: pyridoxamine 5'-phosphate oxidase family protein [Pseudomonadota bacterium]
MDDKKNPRDQLWALIKNIRFGMFTTRHANGHFHSHPMTTQNKLIEADDRLWFFMSRGSETVRSIAAQPTVNVAYADPGQDRYVSVSGEAKVVEDRAKMEALWTTMSQAWFPGGTQDPDLALVGVRVIHAHYWDVKENKLTQMYEMAKAAMTGTTPSEMGESGELRLTT